MFIGQKVKILHCLEYKYTSSRREGQEGEIQKFDPACESYWIQFDNGDTTSNGSWYSSGEFEVISINPELKTVGQAIDFLVKAGYNVTIEKE